MNSEDSYDNSGRFSFFLDFCFQGILQLAYK